MRVQIAVVSQPPVAGARSLRGNFAASFLRSVCALRLLESAVLLKTPETGRFDNTALLRLGARSDDPGGHLRRSHQTRRRIQGRCQGLGLTVARNTKSRDTVRLELNGKEIATRQINGGRLTARSDVPSAAGELKAVGLKNGKIVATKSLRTVGPAKKVRLTFDRATIRANRNDLAFVTVEITDAAGNVLPDATNMVHFKLTGPGELAAVGSGAPNVLESFRQPQHTAWHGRCLAILRPLGPTGKLAFRAEVDGLLAGQVAISVK